MPETICDEELDDSLSRLRRYWSHDTRGTHDAQVVVRLLDRDSDGTCVFRGVHGEEENSHAMTSPLRSIEICHGAVDRLIAERDKFAAEARQLRIDLAVLKASRLCDCGKPLSRGSCSGHCDNDD